MQGTPADCVILAHGALFDTPFDLIFSGINLGTNMGADVLLSGTVGAALHGYLRGVPSVAVSSYYNPDRTHYAAACIGAVAIASDLSASPVTVPMLLNVNLPDVEPTEVEGVEITVPGSRAFVEGAKHEIVGRREHYWIKHNRVNTESDAEVGTDVWAVQHKRVSISSISPLITDGIPITTLAAARRGRVARDGDVGWCSRIVTVGPFPPGSSHGIPKSPHTDLVSGGAPLRRHTYPVEPSRD